MPTPPRLRRYSAAAKKVIEEGMEIRTYATFGAWVADGCFPKTTCDEEMGSESPAPR